MLCEVVFVDWAHVHVVFALGVVFAIVAFFAGWQLGESIGRKAACGESRAECRCGPHE